MVFFSPPNIQIRVLISASRQRETEFYYFTNFSSLTFSSYLTTASFLYLLNCWAPHFIPPSEGDVGFGPLGSDHVSVISRRSRTPPHRRIASVPVHTWQRSRQQRPGSLGEGGGRSGGARTSGPPTASRGAQGLGDRVRLGRDWIQRRSHDCEV